MANNTKPRLLFSDRAIEERLRDYTDRQALFANEEHPMTGIATGIAPLDHVTMGVQRNDLWVIQGRTGVGKTYLLCSMAHHMRRQGKRVLFVNREMDPVHVLGRIDSLAAHFSFHRWRQGKLTADELKRYQMLTQWTASLPKDRARIDVLAPIPNLTPATLKKVVDRYHPDVVIVDYINRMGSDGYANDRLGAIQQIADGLKDLAYHDGIPVVAAAQSNRQTTFLKGKAVPGTEHLYGGDIIGWNADLVMSMYRNTEMLVKGYMGLRMAKYRHGEELDIILNWNLKEGRITVETVGNMHAEMAAVEAEELV